MSHDLTEKQNRALKMPAHLKKAVKISDIYKWQILDANFLIDLENGKVHWDDFGANLIKHPSVPVVERMVPTISSTHLWGGRSRIHQRQKLRFERKLKLKKRLDYIKDLKKKIN